ncbi:hypothetical protein E4P40_23425 [Blastococcus sp. CT_GayMR20]|uniref:hypothetical protein n=1 Tax=Blastococcus sp. CT_GayMR20 TaxID=2559609 RepID=UPI00107497C0|nr:hypothetical protein [Blastococcus sp. CT_GayMR20]TFV68452.1 hypothetical protein E4P40_23425 [Blastococcus sp. CT_GayMR20]
MHATGRRRLPPVPRPSPERTAQPDAAAHDDDLDGPVTERLELDLSELDDGGPATERFQVDLSEDDDPTAAVTPPAQLVPPPAEVVPVATVATEAPTAPEPQSLQPDAAQEFVARLRSAAAEFAEAAGAASAVVREAVPPARHRRARCRVVLRYDDDTESDVTFLGPAGSPGTRSRHGFDRQIRRWLGSGQHREDAWVVADPDAPDGLAVDVTAWLTAG